MIHRFIEKHNSLNLQPCSKFISGNNSETSAFSESFNPLMPGGNERFTHTETNLQLNAGIKGLID